MLARSAVFEHVNFDPRYNFWFELFDFGMQCVAAGGGVRMFATHRAAFTHDPGGYTHPNMSNGEREEDRRRFMAKWRVRQVGATGGPRR